MKKIIKVYAHRERYDEDYGKGYIEKEIDISQEGRRKIFESGSGDIIFLFSFGKTPNSICTLCGHIYIKHLDYLCVCCGEKIIQKKEPVEGTKLEKSKQTSYVQYYSNDEP